MFFLQGCILSTILVALLYGREAFFAAVIGCFIAWLPSFAFKLFFFRNEGDKSPQAIVNKFYLAEVAKIALFIPMVIVALQVPGLKVAWFMLFLAVSQVALWAKGMKQLSAVKLKIPAAQVKLEPGYNQENKNENKGEQH